MTEQDKAHLYELEESLWRDETRFDQEYMEQVLAVDFFEFGRSGKIYTRAECLAIPAQKIGAKFPLREFHINELTSEVVQVTYISEIVGANGKTHLGNRSSLWQKSDGRWQLKFHQGTVVTAPLT